MKVLVTGGAGYIGSHTCVVLLEAGHDVTVLDNLANSKQEALRRVERITGRKPDFHLADLLDYRALQSVFSENRFDAVIHFAGLKAVGESVREPLRYYDNNITGSINLFRVMMEHDLYNLVFSSSATVYGTTDKVPIGEEAPLSALNPYGRTKLMLEEILRDLAASDPRWHILLLRYFNPVGAHASGLIGEDPNGIPNNLMPVISQVAVGRLAKLNVFGNDYPTPDGTCIRDYIHVMDLASGHLRALEALENNPGCDAINLGTGRGYSVLETIRAFEASTHKQIPYEIAPRREGDAMVSYANPQKAARLLNWRAEREIEEMCRDAWRWQSQNPTGYDSSPSP